MPPASLIAGSIPNASSSSTPFFVVPAQPPASRPHQPRNVTFAVPAAPRPAQSRPEIPVVLDTANLFSYKAPAHKHAHHLHSIPPRDKTAKTLILDHMLWQHTRARFLQAHSELGLATSGSGSGSSARDRTDHPGVDAAGPPDAARPPPAELLEDDIRALKYGVRGIDRIKAYFEDTADERASPLVDLDTARVQRATADGMEKVRVLLPLRSIYRPCHTFHCFACHTCQLTPLCAAFPARFDPAPLKIGCCVAAEPEHRLVQPHRRQPHSRRLKQGLPVPRSSFADCFVSFGE